jgi:hypothetical protein
LETSDAALLAYHGEYPELIKPWRWFSAWSEGTAGVAPVADWTTPPLPFVAGLGAARSLRRRPLLDLCLYLDLGVAPRRELPPMAGAHRGDLGVGKRKAMTRNPGATPPAAFRESDLSGLGQLDRDLLRQFGAIMGGLSANTQRNYHRVLVDILRAAGGVESGSMPLFLASLSLPPQRRPLARPAWAKFADFVSIVPPNSVGGRALAPDHILSGDLARRAGVDLATPWPEPAREHLLALVQALSPRLVHRIRARHLTFRGCEVVAIENPLCKAVTVQRLPPEVRHHLTEWVS